MPIVCNSQKLDCGLVTLDILWTYLWDSGVYECRATNDHGTASTSATITVSFLEGADAAHIRLVNKHWKSEMDCDLTEYC